MNRGTRVAAFALVAALTAGAGATGRSAEASKTSVAKVGVRLEEFKLIASVRRSPAGQVTFVARNAGKLTHELVVLKTTKPAGKLPMKGLEAVEKGRVGKLPSLAPGTTKKLTLRLGAAHYALICNIPGHYKAGQFADLTVR